MHSPRIFFLKSKSRVWRVRDGELGFGGGFGNGHREEGGRGLGVEEGEGYLGFGFEGLEVTMDSLAGSRMHRVLTRFVLNTYFSFVNN
jgi:hypothetical protein